MRFKGRALTAGAWWRRLILGGAFLSSRGAEAASVFDLGEQLNTQAYTIMITVVLFGLVAFDLALEAFEHYLRHHKPRFHQRLLEKSIKVLMILGFISFTLFILEDQGCIPDDEVFANTFNFVNLFLFFVGVALVIAAVLIAMFTSPLKSRWDAFANLSKEEVLAMHANVTSKPRTFYLWLPRYSKALRQAQVVEYHLFRSVFLRLNRHLLTPAFDFAKYSATVVDEIIINNFDISWQSWLLAIVVLFVTLPISTMEDGSAQVSAHGAIIFGVALLVMELSVMWYVHWAHKIVCSRMGVKGGFNGVGKVLEQLWVEPRHYMGESTSAINVRALLAAAPVKAPNLTQLTSSDARSSQVHINFSNGRSNRASASTSESGNDRTTTSSGAPSWRQGQQESEKLPCETNGPDCSGCESCDDMWLPPNAVRNCEMGGDPFIFRVVRLPQWAVSCLPKRFKGVSFKIGSHGWFSCLFGMCVLMKCYYTAFYFSYAIGRATEEADDPLQIVLWVVVTPIPLLLALLPLAKRTLPLYAQMGCLQGQIVWEIVSEIEEQQEMAERSRDQVVCKLQEALAHKAEEYKKLKKEGTALNSPETLVSPRSLAMNHWFEEWDKNKDGSISKNELSEGLTSLGVFLSEAQLKELFRLADPDHSKSIDLEEFRNFLSALRSLETEPENFRRDLEIRRMRSMKWEEKERQLKISEAGLLVERTRQAPVSRAGPLRRSWSIGKRKTVAEVARIDRPAGAASSASFGAGDNGDVERGTSNFESELGGTAATDRRPSPSPPASDVEAPLPPQQQQHQSTEGPTDEPRDTPSRVVSTGCDAKERRRDEESGVTLPAAAAAVVESDAAKPSTEESRVPPPPVVDFGASLHEGRAPME